MYVVYRCGEGGPLLEHLLGVVDVEVDDAHLVAALLGGDQGVDLLQQLVILLPVDTSECMYVCMYEYMYVVYDNKYVCTIRNGPNKIRNVQKNIGYPNPNVTQPNLTYDLHTYIPVLNDFGCQVVASSGVV